MAKTGPQSVQTQVVQGAARGAMNVGPKAGATASNRETIRKQFLADLQKLKKLDPTSSAYKDLKTAIEKAGTTLKYKPANINNYITRYTKAPTGTTPPTPPTPSDKFPGMTPEQQDKTLVGQGGQPFLNLVQVGDNFDPNNPYSKYETAFTQARNRAYNDVMSQFERSTQDEFARQNAQFQQRMAEQGIDPASATYQAQFKALSDAQGRARQDAMSAASSRAYEVQNQAYTQAAGAVNQLTEMAKVGLVPWQQVQEARAQLERQKAVIAGEEKRTEMTTKSAENIAEATKAKSTTAPGPASIEASFGQGLLQGGAGSFGRVI